MKRNYVLIIIILLVNNSLYAQDIGLTVNDTLPYFQIPIFSKLSKSLLNTKDLTDKLVIFDFWSTNCSGCVAALPRLDSLQNKYNSKIVILPVTNEPVALVKSFLKHNKYARNISLSIVADDKTLEQYFKHKYIPHEVWVYKGIVIGITGEDYVDEFNIDKVINGESINWPIKNDFSVFDKNKPLFNFDSSQIDTDKTFVRYSAISGYIENVNSIGFTGGRGIIRDSIKNSYRAFFINQPILNSYRQLLSNTLKSEELIKPDNLFSPNEVIWEVKDRAKYFYDKEFGYSQDWLRKNAICFEFVNHNSNETDQQIYKNMVLELNALLGLNVRWILRKEIVYVLCKLDNKKYQLKKPITGKFYDLWQILHNLNLQPNNPYSFNDIKSDTAIKLWLNVKSWTDFESIKKQLNDQGFDLKKENRYVNKLIFTEINGGLLASPTTPMGP